MEKLRPLKKKVEENSKVIDSLVDSIITKYSRDLHQFIENVKALIEEAKQRNSEVSDVDLEHIVLEIPVYMYFASNGLETLGIEGDNAKAIRMEVLNEIYLEAKGTIQDKQKAAELQTMQEYLIEIAFTRAYKKLKTQVEMADKVFSGAKKVLSKRMLEVDVLKRDPGHTRRGDYNEE